MHAVLDTAVFLLLVGAAMGTLLVPAQPLESGAADAAMTVVSTTTSRVTYVPGGGPATGNGSVAPAPGRVRTARGTLADLLATAAVRAARVDGERVGPPAAAFERAVVAAVERATRPGRPVAVRAGWTPYPDAPIRGTVRAGPRPPGDADVWAARITVTTDAPATTGDAPRGDDGFGGVAGSVGRSTVATLFPPEATSLALRADGPTTTLTATRYRRFATLTGASVRGPVRADTVRRRNDRLTAALVPRLEHDLRAAYDTPAGAARAVTVGVVRITVRVWERP